MVKISPGHVPRTEANIAPLYLFEFSEIHNMNTQVPLALNPASFIKIY